MKIAPLPSNETDRLEALRQTGVLDTDSEQCFDRLTDLAARLCSAPIALITLVDVDRQWFKSHFGLEVAETPREVAFCAHAILQPAMLVVRDALMDERFADNPLVTSDPKIRFYAGSPLVTHDGNALGTFCVIDTIPRDLDPEQVAALQALTDHTTNMLELRRTKELLRVNAEAWERATAEGDNATCASSLAQLGENLQRMIATREKGEISVRDLERSLQRITARATPLGRDTVPELDHLLTDIIESSERILGQVGHNHVLRTEAIRMRAAARKGRDLIGEEKQRGQLPPVG